MLRIVDKTTRQQDLDFKPSERVIFLAGPCPRGSTEQTQWQNQWHAAAVGLVKQYTSWEDTTVCIPLPYETDKAFEEGVAWEDTCMERADAILFWVPRDLEKLPGFTTNVEFGEYLKSGKIILAYPEGAPKMRYMAVKARWHDIPVSHDLEGAVREAVSLAASRATQRNRPEADSLGAFLS